MTNLIALAQHMGPFVLVPILFIVVGIGTFVTIAGGLLTGGPRALNQPGSPHLYDRLYYLIWLVAMTGWAGGLLSFAGIRAGETELWGFVLGWAICAVGMGSLFLLRGDMMIKGARYLAENGVWLTRWHNRMQVRQLERQNPFVRKLIPFIFLIAGTVALAISFPHIAEAVADVRAGAMTIVHLVTNP